MDERYSGSAENKIARAEAGGLAVPVIRDGSESGPPDQVDSGRSVTPTAHRRNRGNARGENADPGGAKTKPENREQVLAEQTNPFSATCSSPAEKRQPVNPA